MCKIEGCGKHPYTSIGAKEPSPYCAPHWWAYSVKRENRARNEVEMVNLGKCQLDGCGNDIIVPKITRSRPRKYCSDFCSSESSRRFTSKYIKEKKAQCQANT